MALKERLAKECCLGQLLAWLQPLMLCCVFCFNILLPAALLVNVYQIASCLHKGL